MSVIVTRNGKGSPLTFNEADANFENLNNDKYELNSSPTFNVVTATQYIGGEFTSTLAGIVPASGGGTTNFLRADGTWFPASGGGSGDFVSPDGFFNFRHAGAGSVTAQLSPTDPNNTTSFTAYSYDLVEGGSGSGTGDNVSVSLSATSFGNNQLLHVNKHGTGTYAGYKPVSIGPGPATGLISIAATFGWNYATGADPYVDVAPDFRISTKHIDEYIDDRVDALIVAGTNITKTYNDGANTLTLSASGGGSSDVSTDPIWDAKGDLVVGTGANTAAKLSAGTNGHVLTLDSAEPTGMKWAAGGGGGSPGGSNTHIQFNDGGSLGGDADFTWDKTNNVLTFGNSSRISGPMSSGTSATAFALQTSEPDSLTIVNAIPNGFSQTAVYRANSSSSFAGAGFFGQFGVIGNTYVGVTSSKNNPAGASGLDIRIQQLLSGSTREVAQFYPSGNVNFGTTTTDPGVSFRVEGAARFNGKLSLGSTLVEWDSGYEHIDVGTAAVISATSAAVYLCNNLYYQAGSWRYKTGAAGALNIVSGTDWYHFTAPSGTTGNPATITQRLRWEEANTRFDVNGNLLRLRTANTPASATAAGEAGDICWDSNYVYVCVATNTWKRSALSTW
jgi:hypothetical protein